MNPNHQVIKCSDCNCRPKECKMSTSAKQCPNCTFDECCCWPKAQTGVDKN